MPIDPGQMRKITEHNEQVTTSIRTMNDKVKNLDPRNYEESTTNVKNWTQNVHDLKVSLEKQGDLSKAMRENARIDEERHGESFRDKFSFLIDRLRDDIRFFYHSLQEFVDCPQDFSRVSAKTWDHYIHDMEMDVKKTIPAIMSDNMPAALDTIVTMMNFRDGLMSHLLNGLLFQKAVLDWDLKSPQSYADKPMVEMAELVVELYSKTQSVSAKLTGEMPSLLDIGPFTYDKSRFDKSEEGQTMDLSPLQSRLIACLHGMQSLDRGMRNMKFGQSVTIEENGASKSGRSHRDRDKLRKDDKYEHGQYIAAESLRDEVTKWFRKCQTLEQESQTSKAQRHAPLEQQVENLTNVCSEKETANKKQRTQINKLDGELQSLRNELQTTKRERAELFEKNAKMQKENVPMLNQMDKLLGKSRESVNVLTADAEMLSNMFKEQMKQNAANVEKHETMSKELAKIHKHLKNERLKNDFKEDELHKKETLYVRTMAARKSIHEAYLEQKAQITEVEEKMKSREDDWQEMLKVVQGRDSEIKHLKEDLLRSHQRIDELEQQKKMCMTEFKRLTGKPVNMLLEQFKAEPTSPPSALDGTRST